jgi:hypothetical protein
MRILLLSLLTMIAPSLGQAQTPSPGKQKSTPTSDTKLDSRSNADSRLKLELGRTRSGLWVGPQLTNGQFIVESVQASSDTRIHALPGLAAGVELWPTDTLGVFVAGVIGFGVDIDADVVKAQFGDPDAEGETTISYTVHQFEAGGRYRWFFGPDVSAPSAFVALGVRGRFQSARDQFPTILLDRMVLGPEATLGGTLSIANGRAWIRGSARIGSPFFVRETPTDSGDPRSFLDGGGRLEIVAAVTGRWSIQVRGDLTHRILQFAGQATRGFGAEDVKTRDRFINLGFYLRYCPVID